MKSVYFLILTLIAICTAAKMKSTNVLRLSNLNVNMSHNNISTSTSFKAHVMLDENDRIVSCGEYVVDGETYQKISNTYTNMPKSIGTEVPIKYNPNNPKDAIWVSDSNNIVLPIAGVAFTLVGIFFIVLTVKNEKKKKNNTSQMRLRSVFKMRMSILNTATTEQMG